jgi:hypothetical protein
LLAERAKAKALAYLDAKAGFVQRQAYPNYLRLLPSAVCGLHVEDGVGGEPVLAEVAGVA